MSLETDRGEDELSNKVSDRIDLHPGPQLCLILLESQHSDSDQTKKQDGSICLKKFLSMNICLAYGRPSFARGTCHAHAQAR